jgi:hypothetical protein
MPGILAQLDPSGVAELICLATRAGRAQMAGSDGGVRWRRRPPGGDGGDDAARRLTALPGIGPWTAAEVGMVALGDPDAVSVSDYHLPNQVAWALAGEPGADDARMLELLEPYRGQRGRVIRLILAGATAGAHQAGVGAFGVDPDHQSAPGRSRSELGVYVEDRASTESGSVRS